MRVRVGGARFVGVVCECGLCGVLGECMSGGGVLVGYCGADIGVVANGHVLISGLQNRPSMMPSCNCH